MPRGRIDVSTAERLELEAVLRRQFVVRDEQDFITSFDPSHGDTLQSALSDLETHYHDPDGLGYDEADMVVWQAGRIVAVVRRGDDGQPETTRFTPDLD